MLPTQQHPYFVLTGGPGCGKTTLIEALHTLGFRTIPEVARDIIKEQMETGGDALPWKNRERYTQLMLERSIVSYQEAAQNNSPAFFDRGLPDTLCYGRLIGLEISTAMEQAAWNYRYHKSVFLLPPWKAIYTTDSERKQDWAEAVRTHTVMAETYQEYGYSIIEVPKKTVQERIAFLQEIVNL